MVTSTREVELAEPPAEIGRREEVEQFLDRFHEGWPSGVLEWVLRPMLHERFLGPVPGSSLPAPLELARHLATAQVRARGVRVLVQGGAAFAIDGTNLRRVLEPIVETRRSAAGDAFRVVPVLDRRRLLHWTRHATSYAGSLIRASEQAGIPVPSAEVRRYCLGGARALTRAEGILRASDTRVLVVATQHAPNVRALLATARDRGIASVYLPHAPVAANRQYFDLPVDYAGLRGMGEVDVYRRQGVSADLPLVGNPALDDLEEGEPSGLAEPPVFAAPTQAPAVLEQLFRLIASVLGDEHLLVSPHPRSDREELTRLTPPSWRLWPGGRTFDLLRRGPKFVLQHSSGVAWEALALGIPVVQLGYPGEQSNYPLIAPPSVLFAHSTASLSRAVAEATSRSTDLSGREELRAWAGYWCNSVGRRARESCAALVEQARQDGPRPEVILDGWRDA